MPVPSTSGSGLIKVASSPATWTFNAPGSKAFDFAIPTSAVEFASGYVRVAGVVTLGLVFSSHDYIAINAVNATFGAHGNGSYDMTTPLTAAQLTYINANRGSTIVGTYNILTEFDVGGSQTITILELVLTTQASGMPTGGQEGTGGVKLFTEGQPAYAVDFNSNFDRLLQPNAYMEAAAVLEGGVCTTPSAGVVRIPSATIWFAQMAWTAGVDIDKATTNGATEFWWGCSDGGIRSSGAANTPPSSFSLRTAALICKTTNVAGVVTVDNTVQHKGSYFNSSNRIQYFGPMYIDYVNNVLGGIAVQNLIGDNNYVGEVTTTDATVTTALQFTPADGRTLQVEWRVVARKADGTQGAAYRFIAAFRRAGSTITQIGALVSVATLEDDATWNATVDISGTNIRVRVTGVAATTITWRVRAVTNELG